MSGGTPSRPFRGTHDAPPSYPHAGRTCTCGRGLRRSERESVPASRVLASRLGHPGHRAGRRVRDRRLERGHRRRSRHQRGSHPRHLPRADPSESPGAIDQPPRDRRRRRGGGGRRHARGADGPDRDATHGRAGRPHPVRPRRRRARGRRADRQPDRVHHYAMRSRARHARGVRRVLEPALEPGHMDRRRARPPDAVRPGAARDPADRAAARRDAAAGCRPVAARGADVDVRRGLRHPPGPPAGPLRRGGGRRARRRAHRVPQGQRAHALDRARR